MAYYEALPIYKAAMDTAVRVDTAVQRRRLAVVFERPAEGPTDPHPPEDRR